MKERTTPHLLEILPRLMHRLPKSHRSWEDVYSDHYKVKAGFGGEQHVDGILKRSRNRYVAIADLQLAERFCQIDTVVLTPAFALVLEVKNYSGTLKFNKFSFHMEQETRDGKRLGFKSPATQVWNAREELALLFGRFGVSLPIHTAIVLPYSSTLVEGASTEFPVIYGNALNHFISRLPQTERLSHFELESLGQLLIDHHSPLPKTDLSKIYSYTIDDLKKGVLCSMCGSSCRKTSQRTFLCMSCGINVVDGYQRALEDWCDFVAPGISSEQVRNYLGLKDKHAVGYLMRKMGFCRGVGSRVYVRL